MRLLLDECLPRKLKRSLSDYAVATVQEMGWSGIKNGALLTLAEANFDVFVTIDGNLQYQQNLRGRNVAIIVLAAKNNTFNVLNTLVPSLLAALQTIQPGDLVRLSN